MTSEHERTRQSIHITSHHHNLEKESSNRQSTLDYLETVISFKTENQRTRGQKLRTDACINTIYTNDKRNG